MTIRLLTETSWQTITRTARKATSAKVAVAYFGQEGSRLLPLKAGSVLVIDLSQKAVRSGQTCPQEIIKLLNKGVEVHSCSNLHAKMFVFGRRVMIGSANVSNHSKHGLIEAVVETTDAETVRACKAFVDSLRGEHVDLEYAEKMAKIYNPPKLGSGARTKHPGHPSFWLVPLEEAEWDDDDRAVFKQNERIAKGKLQDKGHFFLDHYIWTGGGFRTQLKVGELILQVVKERSGTTMLTPPSRAILIRRYGAPAEKKLMVFLRTPRIRRKNLRHVKGRLEAAGNLFHGLNNPRLVKNRKLAHELLQLWPSLRETE